MQEMIGKLKSKPRPLIWYTSWMGSRRGEVKKILGGGGVKKIYKSKFDIQYDCVNPGWAQRMNHDTTA